MRVGPIITVILSALVLSSLWWLETLRDRERPDQADPDTHHAAEAYFDDFSARAWDRDGGPRHTMRGRRMERFSDDETSHIEEPRVHYHQPAGTPWYLAASNGQVDGTGDRVDLEERVVAMRNPNIPNPMVARTRALTVFLDEGRATTDDPVRVVSSGSRLHSIGMTAFFDTGIVELHNDVRGRHDPAIATP